MVDRYAGAKAELRGLIGKDNALLSATSDAFFRNNISNRLDIVLTRAVSALPEKHKKTELTEEDMKLMSLLMGDVEKYKTLIPDRVKEICETLPDMAELFALDNRYAMFVPDGTETA